MANDIASLGVEVNTESVKQATEDLNQLNQAGAATEQAAKQAGSAWSNAASQMSKAGNPAKQTAQTFSQGTQAINEQQKALADLLGKIDPVVGALGRLDAMEEQLRKHASTGLLPKDDFDEYAKKIQAMRDGLAGSDEQLKKTGVSAAQTAAALRMLPAQFTDIFTQLAGGANPLLVLIQQGGQIKDSFGGIGNAFDVLGGKVKNFFGSLTGFNTADVTSLGGALSDIAKQQENIAENSDSAIDGISGTAESVNNLSEAADTVKVAATGVTSSTAAMVGGFLAAAAALAALAVAYKQGSDEQTAYAKALILTGNAAGVTTDQLADLARQVGSETGTIHDAADALTQFAATGKFASSQLGELATAALNFEDATGKAVSETVKEFAKLADDPVKAAAQLNEEYHFLTAAVYEQITALEKQGNTEEAAALAQKAYADALRDRSTQVIQSLGYIETAWKNIKEGAASAWDAMLGVGRTQTVQDRLDELNKGGGVGAFDFKKLASSGFLLGPVGAAYEGYKQFNTATMPESERRQKIAFLQQQQDTQNAIAKAQGLYAEEQQKGIAAQREVDSIEKQFLTNAEKRNKEIKEYRRQLEDIRKANPNDARLDEDRIAKNIANIEAKYKDPKTPNSPRTKAFTDDAATRMLQSLREQGAELQAQLGTQDKLTASQKAQAQFVQLISDLKGKSQLTADQKSLLANQDAINAQLQMNVALDDQVQKRKELLQLEQRSAQLQETMAASNDSRQEQYQRQLDAFGMGKEQLERVRSQATIFREFQRYQAQLDKATPKDLLGSEQYKTAAAEIKSGLNDALAANEDYYNKLDKLRGDWANGAKESFADYLDSAKDVAGQTYDLFSNALKGTEDALVEFVRTGKLSFGDLADSIIADLIRIQVRQAVAYAAGGSDGNGGLIGALSLGASALAGFFGGSSSSAAGASTSGYTGDAYSSWLKSHPSFDGGGPTGNGMRMGGVDGKGGFMAILHPQETVIDHTKPSANQAGVVNNYAFSFPNITNASEARQATAVAARNFNAVSQRAARYQ